MRIHEVWTGDAAPTTRESGTTSLSRRMAVMIDAALDAHPQLAGQIEQGILEAIGKSLLGESQGQRGSRLLFHIPAYSDAFGEFHEGHDSYYEPSAPDDRAQFFDIPTY